jgi:hypothetical protein
VWIWEQTAIISLYNTNWLVFITESECLLRGMDWVLYVSTVALYTVKLSAFDLSTSLLSLILSSYHVLLAQYERCTVHKGGNKARHCTVPPPSVTWTQSTHWHSSSLTKLSYYPQIYRQAWQTGILQSEFSSKLWCLLVYSPMRATFTAQSTAQQSTLCKSLPSCCSEFLRTFCTAMLSDIPQVHTHREHFNICVSKWKTRRKYPELGACKFRTLLPQGI